MKQPQEGLRVSASASIEKLTIKTSGVEDVVELVLHFPLDKVIEHVTNLAKIRRLGSAVIQIESAQAALPFPDDGQTRAELSLVGGGTNR